MSSRRAMLESLKASYVTPYRRAGIFSRIAPTLLFYAWGARIVLRTSERARDGFYGDAAWRDSAFEIRDVFENGGTPIIIENLEVFDRFEGPCVIIGNHMATTETFLLPGWLSMYRRVTFVVKQALLEYPIFKHIMRARDPVVVGRKDPRADLTAVLQGGTEKIQQGISVVIFPQKTRKVEFEPEEFNSIGVKLAKRAKVPIIPLAVKTDAWANGKMLKDFGPYCPDKPVHFAFGEPLEITGTGKEQNEAVIAFIQAKLAEWQDWDARWLSAKK